MADAPVLTTGGAGFIASNLALDNPRVELIEGDVADAAVVARLLGR